MARKTPLLLEIVAAVLLAPVVLAALATLALKIFFPPEKLRALIVSEAQKNLHREVRLQSISLGIAGVTLDGLEVSEHPDFSAGTFAAVESFQLRPQWAPLLRKQVVIDRVSVSGAKLRVAQDRKGNFNFSDLTASSPAPKEKPAAASPSAPIVLDVHHASLSHASIAYRDATGGGWNVTDIDAKTSNFGLDKAFPLSLSLAAAQTSVGGVKARLNFSGHIDLSQQSKGKLTAEIERLRGDVSGIPFEIAGSAKMDPDVVSLPDLQGKLGEGKLTLSARVNHYATAPDADLKLSLDKLDVGALMAARPASEAPTPPPASAAGKTPAVAAKPTAPPSPIKARGKIDVGSLIYSGFTANSGNLSFALTGITPDLKNLAGWAKLSVSGGTLSSAEKNSTHSKVLQALMIPITILKELGALGEKLKLLPDFNHIVFKEIYGDYVFNRGVMTLNDFHMYSAAANIKTTGTIDLPAQKLALKVRSTVAKLAPIDIDVGGTFDKPEPHLRLDKTLLEPARRLITQPAVDILKKIFK